MMEWREIVCGLLFVVGLGLLGRAAWLELSGHGDESVPVLTAGVIDLLVMTVIMESS